MDEHEKILDDIIENHIFGETHKEYLKNDGSMNKSGLSLLRSIRAKPFSWNDRKIDGYQVFHLNGFALILLSKLKPLLFIEPSFFKYSLWVSPKI
jgi:hypothetical protein